MDEPGDLELPRLAPTAGEFSPDALFDILTRLPLTRGYLVAFSGGCDSAALLHALAVLRPRLSGAVRAIHVDHGLSPHGRAWAAHCLSVCQALDIRITLERVDASARRGESPEAAARRARYALIANHLGTGEVLLTAHHQDDQAETLLLQLFRGAGPKGLAAMGMLSPFAGGYLARPLLGFSQAALHRYAEAEGLEWVTDPSNFDTGYDRNFLRHELMPMLAGRWPAVARVLSRSAGHFAEAAGLLDELAERDLAECRGGPAGTLSVPAVAALSPARARNLLRHWLHRSGLPLPDTVRLERILCEVVGARPDRVPEVTWAGGEVRRYRDALYALRPLAVPGDRVMVWTMEHVLPLPPGLGRLVPERTEGRGLRLAACLDRKVTIRFRRGGERCRPAGRGHTHDLKKLFQESGVPPWQRGRAPLLYIGSTLAMVPGVAVCEPFAAQPGEPGITVRWERAGIES